MANESWLIKEKKKTRKNNLLSVFKYTKMDFFSEVFITLISGVLFFCDADKVKYKKQKTSNTRTEEIEKGKENLSNVNSPIVILTLALNFCPRVFRC